MSLISTALLAWLALMAGLLAAWRRDLTRLWHEPVFKAPVLIVESDDWGAGPLAQAEALAAMAACLGRHRDAQGRPAQMTLALVLALPKRGGNGQITLAGAEFRPILDAIRAGAQDGVFALQLHGMTHLWPEAVRVAALAQPEVRAWLADPQLTERLPSHLQSRWTDASTLPSRPHEPEAVQGAVAEEAACYAGIFGAAPAVVVPPTFVWTQEVEAAWAKAGARVIITPGRRQTRRDAEGRPAGVDRDMRNGERGAGGVLYLVRDEYFEPLFGHRPEQALAALARKTALGRPCLLETHRWNFLAETGGDLGKGVAALDELYGRALRDFPGLRFAACAELGGAIASADPGWIEQDRRRRFTIWLRRAAGLPRFGKLAHLSGLLFLLGLFAKSDRRHP